MRRPSATPPPEMRRVVQDIYDELNDLDQTVAGGDSSISVPEISRELVRTQASLKSVVTRASAQGSQINAITQRLGAGINEIELKVGAGEVISAINLSPEQITISSDRIQLNGEVALTDHIYSSDFDGTIDADGNVTDVGTAGWAISSGTNGAQAVFQKAYVRLTEGEIAGAIPVVAGASIQLGQVTLGEQDIQVVDQQATPITRVKMGKVGTNAADYGLEIYDASGGVIIDLSGLGDGTVNTRHLVAEAVTAVKIAADSISAGHIQAGAIDATHIGAATVTTTEVAFTPLISAGGTSDIIATINASAEGIDIDAQHVSISGQTTFAAGYNPADHRAVIRQATSPSARPSGDPLQAGDVWIDTDAQDRVYTWTGSAWQMGSAEADPATDAFSVSIYQTSAPSQRPSGATLVQGDMWYDTDDGNRPYIWNGSSWEFAYTIIDGANIQTGTIATGSLQSGAVTAGKMTIASHLLEGFTWTDNSPGAGSIAWSEGTVTYNGVTYTVAAGSTADEYIWWTASDPSVFQTASSRSALYSSMTYGGTDALIARNANGTHRKEWNQTTISDSKIRTEAIRADHIKADNITTSHLQASSVTASRLAAGAVTTSKLYAGAVTADKIAAGAITTDKLDAGSVTAVKISADAIDGTHIAATAQIQVGGSSPYILLDGPNTHVESSNYVSGEQGFRIAPDFAEFGDLTARGTFRTTVFERNTISAVGGTLVVANASTLSASIDSSTATSVTVKDQVFAGGHTIRLKEGAKDEQMAISSVTNNANGTQTLSVTRGANGTTATTWGKGTAAVRWASERLVLDASDGTYTPFYSVVDDTDTERLRLGNLNGISGASGYGLWLNKGYVGGWEVDADTIKKDTIELDSANKRIKVTDSGDRILRIGDYPINTFTAEVDMTGQIGHSDFESSSYKNDWTPSFNGPNDTYYSGNCGDGTGASWDFDDDTTSGTLTQVITGFSPHASVRFEGEFCQTSFQADAGFSISDTDGTGTSDSASSYYQGGNSGDTVTLQCEAGDNGEIRIRVHFRQDDPGDSGTVTVDYVKLWEFRKDVYFSPTGLGIYDGNGAQIKLDLENRKFHIDHWEIYQAGTLPATGDLHFHNTVDGGGGDLESDVSVSSIDFTGQHRSVPDTLDLSGRVVTDAQGDPKGYAGLPTIIPPIPGHKATAEQVWNFLDGRTGAIMIAAGGYYNHDESIQPRINESLPRIVPSMTAGDTRVFGVLSDREDKGSDERHYSMGAWGTTIPIRDDHRLIVNSLGEGAVLVTDLNGPITNGDYIESSPAFGLGQKQTSNQLLSSTVAKATQDCDFDPNATAYETWTADFYDYSGNVVSIAYALIGCTYHCG